MNDKSSDLWLRFLEDRLLLIHEWIEEGQSFLNIAKTLSMDEIQVELISMAQPNILGYGYGFNINELEILYRLLEHHYIHYDNIEAHAVMNKIMDILKQHELSQHKEQS